MPKTDEYYLYRDGLEEGNSDKRTVKVSFYFPLVGSRRLNIEIINHDSRGHHLYDSEIIEIRGVKRRVHNFGVTIERAKKGRIFNVVERFHTLHGVLKCAILDRGLLRDLVSDLKDDAAGVRNKPLIKVARGQIFANHFDEKPVSDKEEPGPNKGRKDKMMEEEE
ncbi:MAG: hypothetical protein HPY53_01445 [Brevinematales bacterium]|nr:hypothetical protein [Brevinematales bacterium]